MAKANTEYEVIARGIKGKEVIFYDIQTNDKKIRCTPDQFAFLVGRKQIKNATGQMYNGNVVFSGVGCKLTDLTTIKVEGTNADEIKVNTQVNNEKIYKDALIKLDDIYTILDYIQENMVCQMIDELMYTIGEAMGFVDNCIGTLEDLVECKIKFNRNKYRIITPDDIVEKLTYINSVLNTLHNISIIEEDLNNAITNVCKCKEIVVRECETEVDNRLPVMSTKEIKKLPDLSVLLN